MITAKKEKCHKPIEAILKSVCLLSHERMPPTPKNLWLFIGKLYNF